MSASQPRPGRADQRGRDRISTDLGASLVVVAGAGTGKTESLVRRLVNLFAPEGKDRQGIRPANVAAITFTRAAAFELRGRVREQLERDASQTGPAAEAARAQNIAAALRDLDDAAIQTIDSFALSLLRERPLQARLPPVIETLDEIEGGLRFRDRWDEWLGRALEDMGFADALERAMRLGMASPLQELREIAAQFNSRWEIIRPEKFKPEHVEHRALPFLEREAAALRSLLAECTDKEDRLYCHITEKALPVIERLPGLTGAADIESAMASGLRLKAAKLGATGNWPGERRDGQPLKDARAALAAMQEAVDEELAALRRSALNTLLARVASFVVEFAGERRSEGLAGFHDALVWARDLLKSSTAARDYFRARYTHILIDEFQDTDPLQVEIAGLLTHRAAPGRPSPGALFVVGDPKQSIYRFRRADIRAFNSVVANTPDEDVVRLTTNFRSHPDILGWVNAVFGPWMAEKAGPDQAHYVRLEEGIAASGFSAGPHVRLMGGALAGARSDDVRRAEAEALAALALEVGAGGWQVRAGGGTRASVYGDLTVLVRSRTGIEFMERAFEDRGVPFALEGQSLVFHTQDVRDLLNCLAAVDDPTDQVAVVAALRSPAFACDDVALYRWKQAGGSFTYSPGEAGLPQSADTAPVRQAFDALLRYHLMRSSCSTPELIETFIRERRLREIALGGAQARDRLTRLNLVVELARQLHEAGRSSLRDFIRWAEDRQGARERMSESPLDQGTPDAVRVMTIHAAKGLEFPIVALAGLRPPRHQHATVLFGPSGPDAGRVEVRTGPAEVRFQTAGYEELSKAEDSASEAETARLYYVAATRAKDHLLVSVFRSDSAREKGAIATKLADLSEQAMTSNPALCGVWSPSGAPRPTPAHAQGDAPAYEPEAWQADHHRAVAQGRRRATVTASALKSRPAGTFEAAEKTESPVREDEPWRRGRAASELGRAVHAVLEDIDLNLAYVPGTPPPAASGREDRLTSELLRLAKRHARLHGLGAEDARGVALLAAAVLRTPVMLRAKEADSLGRCWREAPVASPLFPGEGPPQTDEGAGPASQFTRDHIPILEGIIDLIFEEPAGDLVIVDYKTDSVRDGGGDTGEGTEQLAKAAAPYVPQLGAYALATEQATGRRVSEAVIVFASRAAEGKDAEYHLPDLAAAKADAARLAQQALAAISQGRPDDIGTAPLTDNRER